LFPLPSVTLARNLDHALYKKRPSAKKKSLKEDLLGIGDFRYCRLSEDFTLKSEDFVIEMPLPEWTDQTMYTFLGPEIEGKSHQILLMIDRILQHDDIERYARDKKKAITQSLQSVEVLKNQQITLQGGNPVFEYVIKWTIQDKKPMFRKYVFVLYKNQGFTFHMDFSRKTYPLLNDQMKKMIEGFIPGTFVPKAQDPYAVRYGMR
jgi:hypothetical protein